ncbi:helix-turn-helix domain-containing protein [Nocardia sp. NPDC004123]
MTGSTVPRRMLGRQLRHLREKAGVGMTQACKAIEVSPQTMWRMEGGQSVKLKVVYIEALCRLYGASDDDTATLLGLIEEAQRTGWWHSYGDCVPVHFDLYLGLEEAAKRLTTWQVTLLPGLLQTTEYRRAMIWTVFPGMPTAAVEQRVEMTVKRQGRLHEADFVTTALLSEAVLHHQVGGPGVMGGQLSHLVALGKSPNVSIRVVPQQVGSHLGLQTGPFVLLEFPARTSPDLRTKWVEPPVVYVEGYTGALYLEKDSEIDSYRSALVEIKRHALDEQDTRDMLAQRAKEYIG